MESRVGKYIRKNMQSMETDRLLKIWIDNDRESYSDEAFKIIAEVIAERKLELPPQKDYKQSLQDKKSTRRYQTTGWLKQFYYPVTDLDVAKKSINMAFVTAIIVTTLTAAYELYYIGVNGLYCLFDIILLSVLTFGIYKKSRVCATIMFILVLIGSLMKFINGVMMQTEGQKPPGFPGYMIMAFFISLIIYQGMRGTFAYHRMIIETEQTKG